jgi:hypothetical protein
VNVIGIGAAGCRIAEALSTYPQYKIFKIDVDISGKSCYTVPVLENAEEYDSYSYPKIKTFFKGIKGETLVVVGGAGKIALGCLRILQHIKKLPISIMYIKPDSTMLSQTQQLQERTVFGVLQEYTRSAVFEKIYLISNPILDQVVGGAPVIGYYDKLNEALVGTLHMINVFKNTEAALGKIEKAKETHRIVTFGVFDIEKNTEKLFFPLDKVRDKCYIYSINEEKMKTDTGLLQRIKNQINTKLDEDLSVGYALYSNQYEYDVGYVIARTPHVQL